MYISVETTLRVNFRNVRVCVCVWNDTNTVRPTAVVTNRCYIWDSNEYSF